MIRTIDIKLNAAHPEIPLLEATTFTGSPSTVRVRGVPSSCGSWHITGVSVVAAYPDNAAHTVSAVQAADGVWVATIPATATSGRTAQGLQILADGVDERGETVTGYVLGVADLAVYSRDMTVESGGTLWYMHLFDTQPNPAKKGDAYLDGTSLNIYNGTAWVEISGGSVELDNSVTHTSANGVKSSGIWSAIWGALTALPTGFASLYDWVVSQLAGKLGNTGIQTLNGDLVLGEGGYLLSADVGGCIISPTRQYITFPSSGGMLALLSDIYAAVQQIAPDFTAKAYALNELCSYNGKLYCCKLAYTASSSSAKPDSDTTHWEAKKVSELFLPLSGGEVSGDLIVDGQIGISAFFSIEKMLGTGLLFTGSINSAERRALLPLANIPDSSIFSIAFLQNLALNYDATATYALNKLCVQGSKLYRCTTAITTAEAWTAAHWTEATVEDVLAAIRSALGAKAPLASPAFTGTPTAPTPTSGDDSTKVATTAFVQAAIAGATPNLDYVMRVDPETGNIYYTTPDAQS